MSEHSEYRFLVAPACGGWVALLHAECTEEAGILSWQLMANCTCDLKSARYVGKHRLADCDLLGWTFTTRGCHSKSDG
jgi:hypothetical protein